MTSRRFHYGEAQSKFLVNVNTPCSTRYGKEGSCRISSANSVSEEYARRCYKSRTSADCVDGDCRHHFTSFSSY